MTIPFIIAPRTFSFHQMPVHVIASDRNEHDISENTLDNIMYGDFLNATLQNVQIDGAAAVR